MNRETPTITSMSYAEATAAANQQAAIMGAGMAGAAWMSNGDAADWWIEADRELAERRIQNKPPGGGFGKPLAAVQFQQALKETHELIEKAKERAMTTRLVKVFIVDPEESLPLADRLLYKSEEILTDSTDTELFFDIDIRGILEDHNKVRSTTVDRKTKDHDKPRMLEPAKVRDLKMQVIVLLSF